MTGDTPSTKKALASLRKVTESPRVLLVLERRDDLIWLSLRNVDTVHLLALDQLNTYDVLVSDDVVFTKDALDEFLAGAPKGRGAKASAREHEVADLSTLDEDDESDVDEVTDSADVDDADVAGETDDEEDGK